MSLTIDLHALQTLPPSLINRDDTGAPKSAIFGGVPRQRVSSQSWKRAIRRHFEDNFDRESVGWRTKRVVDLIATRVVELSEDNSWDIDRAAGDVEQLFKTAGIKLTDPKPLKAKEDGKDEAARIPRAETGYLLFLSPRQVDNAAREIIEMDGEKIKKARAKELLNSEHSVDIAMFGRMVADDATYNVDASVQVAHALGVHESEPEFDYFTAVDDLVEDAQETGAGMIGTTQMMSSTLYRFATIDFESLAENLGDREAAVTTAVEFVKSFVESMPTGKQNTFANNTLPELVYVVVRDSRSISFVNGFEEPVQEEDGRGRREVAAEKLATEAREVEENYGFVPKAAFVTGLGKMTQPFQQIATPTRLPELGGLLRDALVGGED